MILYNENQEPLKDAKSITTEETVLIYFSDIDDAESFVEVYISADEIIILDSECNVLEEKAVLSYAKQAQQSIKDYNNF